MPKATKDRNKQAERRGHQRVPVALVASPDDSSTDNVCRLMFKCFENPSVDTIRSYIAGIGEATISCEEWVNALFEVNLSKRWELLAYLLICTTEGKATNLFNILQVIIRKQFPATFMHDVLHGVSRKTLHRVFTNKFHGNGRSVIVTLLEIAVGLKVMVDVGLIPAYVDELLAVSLELTKVDPYAELCLRNFDPLARNTSLISTSSPPVFARLLNASVAIDVIIERYLEEYHQEDEALHEEGDDVDTVQEWRTQVENKLQFLLSRSNAERVDVILAHPIIKGCGGESDDDSNAEVHALRRLCRSLLDKQRTCLCER